jgi:hypothetical protein
MVLRGTVSMGTALFTGPLKLRTLNNHPLSGRGDNGRRKTTEKAAGPADKEHINSGYGEVFGSVIRVGS